MAKKGAKAKSSSKKEYKRLGNDSDSLDPKSKLGKGSNGRNKDKAGKASRTSRRNHGSLVLNHDDSGLYAAIEADGSRTIVKMADDGNCLFRAISDQLYYDHGTDHAQVRSEVCDLLEAHEDEYAGFLVLDENEPDDDAKDFASYVDAMRRDGEWGGNLELVVAARLYRRNIVVFSANLSALTIEHDSEGIKKPSGPDLLISYHDNQHYNSVRVNALPKPPPPIKTFVRVTSEDAVEVEVEVDATSDDSDGSSEARSDVAEGSGASTEDDDDDLSSTESQADSTRADVDETESVEVSVSRNGSDDGDANESGSDVIKLPPRLTRKNAICPCGSGLRYKKCCLARAKHAARVRNLRGVSRNGGGSSSSNGSPSDPPSENRDDDREELQGGFRVLKI